MPGRLDDRHTLGDLSLAGDQLVPRPDLVKAQVGVTEALEGLAVVAGLELAPMRDGRRVGAVLVAADVVEMVVRVDGMGYVLGRETDYRQLCRDGLARLLKWLLEGEDLVDVVQVVAGIEEEPALRMVDEKVMKVYGGTGVQDAVNQAFFELLQAVVVFPVEDETRLSDKEGRVLPDAFVMKGGSTAIDLARTVHSELAESFLYAVDARTGKRLGSDHVLKDRDIVKIVSSSKRG